MGRILLRQLFEPSSCTYTYILACNKTKQALIIDPVLATALRDAKLVKELGLNLVYGLNTHVHADHVTGTGSLKNLFFPNMRTIISAKSNALSDLKVQHQTIVSIGDNLSLEVRETPGHTNGCLTFVSHQIRAAFTGDSLLIRGCGRTDFQDGDSNKLYKSVHEQIFSLPDKFAVYPAHDYNGQTRSSVGEERKFNPRLILDQQDFVKVMNNLQLAYPKEIDKSVPANLLCGIREKMSKELESLVFPNDPK